MSTGQPLDELCMPVTAISFLGTLTLNARSFQLCKTIPAAHHQSKYTKPLQLQALLFPVPGFMLLKLEQDVAHLAHFNLLPSNPPDTPSPHHCLKRQHSIQQVETPRCNLVLVQQLHKAHTAHKQQLQTTGSNLYLSCHLPNFHAPCHIWPVHGHLTVKAPWPQQCAVKYLQWKRIIY